jgi:Protein of unknown function (DUF3788)
MNLMKHKAPSHELVAKTLGATRDLWDALLDALRAKYGGLTSEWKTSKSDFGWMCVLKHKKRTVVYLTPEDEAVRVAIVLGERAARQALASELPDGIKSLITEARPYAEGRGIRFPIRSVAELPIVMDLIAMKMAPPAAP